MQLGCERAWANELTNECVQKRSHMLLAHSFAFTIDCVCVFCALALSFVICDLIFTSVFVCSLLIGTVFFLSFSLSVVPTWYIVCYNYCLAMARIECRKKHVAAAAASSTKRSKNVTNKNHRWSCVWHSSWTNRRSNFSQIVYSLLFHIHRFAAFSRFSRSLHLCIDAPAWPTAQPICLVHINSFGWVQKEWEKRNEEWEIWPKTNVLRFCDFVEPILNAAFTYTNTFTATILLLSLSLHLSKFCTFVWIGAI